MTNFDKAVQIITAAYKDDLAEYECETIGDFFRIMWMETKDIKRDFWYLLAEASKTGDFDWSAFSDDVEIFENDGKIISFRSLSMAVRKYKAE